jgi:hypothetical protein
MQTDQWRSDGDDNPALEPGDLAIGGRYRVDRQLGTWGIRALYQVTEIWTEQPALLCMLVPAGGGDVAGHVARLAALDHPNLPAVREYVLHGDQLAVVLQAADGMTLDALLGAAVGRPTLEQTVINWGLQICDGLAYLHQQQPAIVVADLAPGAVLHTSSGQLKLLGLGPMLGLYTPAGLIGALEQGYAAPEVYSGRVDVRSDIYAAGALLHFAITGIHPRLYAPGSLPPIRTQRPELSGEVAAVIARAVALAPEQRWQSAAQMGSALRTLVVLSGKQGEIGTRVLDLAPETSAAGAVTLGLPGSRVDARVLAGAAASGADPSPMLAADLPPAQTGRSGLMGMLSGFFHRTPRTTKR